MLFLYSAIVISLNVQSVPHCRHYGYILENLTLTVHESIRLTKMNCEEGGRRYSTITVFFLSD
jgi:hypothetical protein